MWGKNKQLSVFFAGALLFGNYTDPSFLGSRFDLGGDVFAVAFPFTEENYVDGVKITEESIKHLPALFQVNIGHPIGTYLKASLGLSANWDNYQRDDDTGPLFVTPVDTWTYGAELRLTWNQDGLQPRGQERILLARELGALGQSRDLGLQPGSEGLLEALGRPEEDVPLRQLQATRGRHDVLERGQPRPLLAVGFRSVRPVTPLRIPGRQRPRRERRPRSTSPTA